MTASNEMSLDREREFHNARFANDRYVEDTAQSKYYFAVAAGNRRFHERVNELAQGKDVLEYGCATGTISFLVAPRARTVTGIDISDVAVNKANSAAQANGVTNASFRVMNAEAMDFPDQSFDLVFGSGIIHHLDTEKSAREIARVLRPGGAAVFYEPLGYNPIINLYRMLTPSARTPDEHPLRDADLMIFRRCFAHLSMRNYGMLSLASVRFRNSAIGVPLRGMLEVLDQGLFALGPLWRLAWISVVELRK